MRYEPRKIYMLLNRPNREHEWVREKFKKLSGSINIEYRHGEVQTDNELSNMISSIYYSHDLFPDGTTRNNFLFVMTDLFEKDVLSRWYDDEGKRTSKIVIKALKEAGLEVNSAYVQAFFRAWGDLFANEVLYYRIGLDLYDFDLLGRHFCDEDSCFGPFGARSLDPLYLYFKEPAFVVWISKSKKFMDYFDRDLINGRCWGTFNDDGDIFLTNGYYDGIRNRLTGFVRAVEDSVQEGVKYVYKNIEFNSIVYQNGDAIALIPYDSNRTEPRCYYVAGDTCLNCNSYIYGSDEDEPNDYYCDNCAF